MATRYVVAQGDCLSLIAKRFGLLWQDIWNAGENAAFKAKRKNPDILFPGDVLMIPDTKRLSATVSTGQVHRIVIKAQKTRLRVRFQVNGQPLAGSPFLLDVAGKKHQGNTDGSGLVDVEVPADASTAILELPKLPFKQQLQLGTLDPADTLSGAQARLQHLGASLLAVTGAMDQDTALVLDGFQQSQALARSGELDDPTIAALEKAYGC